MTNVTKPDNTKSASRKKGEGRLLRLQKRIISKGVAVWNYWTEGIWSDTRQSWWIDVLKTLNICVKSFTNTDLQTQACAMTYRTTLAIVPALGLLLAIGRGFGFNDFISDELYSIFPGQERVIAQALGFVDMYLSQSSEGIFVGVGIIFLLYTLYSLIDNVETTFNKMWGVSSGRNIWRKITDYTAMMFILPILMICAGGINIFLSSTIQHYFNFAFMTPLKEAWFVCASWVFTWLFFAACYKLIPNTKVKITNALLGGVIAGSAFKVLQWLFVSGQLYVTRYNAIYGSFAFLPLMLLWLQLTWVITLIGALLCYSSQNIFLYAMSTKVDRISPSYRRKVTIVVMTLIVKRFTTGGSAYTASELSHHGAIPPRLVSDILVDLINAGLVVRTISDPKKEVFGYQPAADPANLTIGKVMSRLDMEGDSNFIPVFDKRFATINTAVDQTDNSAYTFGNNILLKSLDIKNLFHNNTLNNEKSN